MHAESLHKFLEKTIKLPLFPLVRPFNWGKLFTVISTSVFVGLIVKLTWSSVKKIITNKDSWAAASLVHPKCLQVLTLGSHLDVHLGSYVQFDSTHSVYTAKW